MAINPVTEPALEAPYAKYDNGLNALRVYPRQPTAYVSILRGERRTVWKPLTALALLAVSFIIWQLVLTGAILSFTKLLWPDTAVLAYFLDDPDNTSAPGPMFLTLSTLAGFIPLTMLVNRLIFGAKPGYLSSVAGHLRPRWLLISLATFIIPFFLFTVVFPLVTGDSLPVNPNSDFVWALVVVLIFTPLQSAGEEYVFRGWLMQTFGSYFRSSTVAWAVLIPVNSVLFVLAHGSSDLFTNLELGAFAVVSSFLVMKTGGLESSIALHATNNTLLFVLSVLSGGQNTYSPRTSTMTLLGLVAGLIFYAAILALILLAWKRYSHQNPASRLFIPQPVTDAQARWVSNVWLAQREAQQQLAQFYAQSQSLYNQQSQTFYNQQPPRLS